MDEMKTEQKQFKKFLLMINGDIRASEVFLTDPSIYIDAGEGDPVDYFIWTPRQVDEDEWEQELLGEVIYQADDCDSLRLYWELEGHIFWMEKNSSGHMFSKEEAALLKALELEDDSEVNMAMDDFDLPF